MPLSSSRPHELSKHHSADTLSAARDIVRRRFATTITDATDERDRIMGLLARCNSEDLSASDLELLEADGKGFAAFIEARLG